MKVSLLTEEWGERRDLLELEIFEVPSNQNHFDSVFLFDLCSSGSEKE